MNFKEDILQGFAQISLDIPVTITFDGVDFTGFKSVLSRQRLYTEQGYQNEYDFTVRVSEDDLTTASKNPRERQQVIVDNVEYRILDSRVDNANAMRRLDLVAEN